MNSAPFFKRTDLKASNVGFFSAKLMTNSAENREKTVRQTDKLTDKLSASFSILGNAKLDTTVTF